MKINRLSEAILPDRKHAAFGSASLALQFLCGMFPRWRARLAEPISSCGLVFYRAKLSQTLCSVSGTPAERRGYKILSKPRSVVVAALLPACGGLSPRGFGIASSHRLTPITDDYGFILWGEHAPRVLRLAPRQPLFGRNPQGEGTLRRTRGRVRSPDKYPLSS